jgi:Na+/H+ antiporter NhaA
MTVREVIDPLPEEPVHRTTWGARLRTPFRDFQRTESGSAAYLIVAALVALIWANVDQGSYQRVWHTVISVDVGHYGVSADARGWVNSGLMTFFFFVVGLEARREFDVGELRERRRVTLPLLAGVGGMVVPVAIYLAFNAGRGFAHGWGAAMSTDTAFALGVLALVGPRFPDRLRSFMLTVLVVDDLVALVVIVVAYSNQLSWLALAVALAMFGAVFAMLAVGIRRGLVYFLVAAVIWVALFKSGIDPVVVGLAMGLLTYAYPAGRSALDRASEGFRLFREQPTAELARQARTSVEAAISPNARLQQLYHPWSSYFIVPLFALANIGIPLGAHFLGHAYASPVTLGILLAYVLGKPIGVASTAWLVSRLSSGRLKPPVGWAAVGGAGAIAGIGFTVSLLIASLAFSGTALQEAKLGVLTAAIAASGLTWVSFRATEMLPPNLRIVALLGRSEAIVDLVDPVDDERDHIRGPAQAPVTLVEYGDFECPYCGQAEAIVRELLADSGDVRYVWRHLPLVDVHPNARLAAEASEAAAMQGAFWPMRDLLFEHQDALAPKDLVRYATELGLDVDRFVEDLHRHTGAARVESDLDSADLSGVAGTPTFFVNGRRHHGAFDIASLKAAVRAARARAAIGGVSGESA